MFCFSDINEPTSTRELSNEAKVSCSRKQQEYLMGTNSRLAGFESDASTRILTKIFAP